MRYAESIWLPLGIALFLLAEVIAVGIVIRAHDLQLRGDHPSVFLAPLFVCLPCLIYFQAKRRIERGFAAAGIDQGLRAAVNSSLKPILVLSYVPLVWSMALLSFTLRALRR